jgi:hypothetical protein
VSEARFTKRKTSSVSHSQNMGLEAQMKVCFRTSTTFALLLVVPNAPLADPLGSAGPF